MAERLHTDYRLDHKITLQKHNRNDVKSDWKKAQYRVTSETYTVPLGLRGGTE
jgi:hypothetical protein